jgi:Gpi18-like mannosyltransferase
MGIKNKRQVQADKKEFFVREEISQPSRPGAWFWVAIVIGIFIRLHLILFTQGAYDAGTWKQHAIGVRDLGLIGYYHANNKMNHPPFIGVAISLLPKVTEATGVPFETLFRAPFALLDAGTLLLLLNLLRNNRHRFAAAAFYWLNPLTMILSSYHGNTDSAIAFFLLLSLWLLSKEKLVLAAVAIGLSLWVKLPGIMAIPAFVFFLQGWRKRLLFLAVIAFVGVSTYIPAIIKDAPIVYKNVFGYHGQIIQTTTGIRAWGNAIQFLLPFFNGLSPQWQEKLSEPLISLLNQSWFISLLLIMLLSWLRRSQKTVEGLGITIAAVYTLLYSFSNYWSFQYFAWSIPFWFFAPPAFLLGATLLAGGYIYSLYWFVCGNPWLLGKWDFVGHPYWPSIVIIFRNLSILFFFLSACIFLTVAVYQQIARWRKEAI